MGAEMGRCDRDDAATLLITPRSVRRVGRSRVAPASLSAAMGTTPAARASPTLQGAAEAEHGCQSCRGACFVVESAQAPARLRIEIGPPS